MGRIGRPHGVRGEVAVEVRTDEPERRFVVGAVLGVQDTSGQRHALEVDGVRRHQDRLLVRFSAWEDRTAVEPLRGAYVYADLPAGSAPDDPEEFYDHQLVGLAVDTDTGRRVGEVTEVRHGAQDLLVVDARASGGEREVLVPFVTALVPEVDLTAGRLLVTDRPGLLDPTQTES